MKYQVKVNAELGRWLEVFSYNVNTTDEEAARRVGVANARQHMADHKAQSYNSSADDWTYTASIE